MLINKLLWLLKTIYYQIFNLTNKKVHDKENIYIIMKFD